MRWKPKPEPVLGEIREKRRFAWLPIRLSDKSVIWFERFYIVEEWQTWDKMVPEFDHPDCDSYVTRTKFGWRRVAVRILP